MQENCEYLWQYAKTIEDFACREWGIKRKGNDKGKGRFCLYNFACE